MKQLCFLLMVFIGCSCKNNSLITRGSKILINDDKCKIVSYYPIMNLKGNVGRKNELNKILEELNEMERHIGNFEAYFPADYVKKKKEIIGDYNILYNSDSLINIEFIKKWTGLSRVEYRNVFVNLTNGQLLEESKAIPNIDRSRLYPYVKKFTDSTGISINLKAYEGDSKYAIMFGRTKIDLILYLGKEGEFGGYYKILIPLTEATK